MPSCEVQNKSVEGRQIKVYKNCHPYNIQCLSTCPDGENFISSDDLTINLWNIENHITAYKIVDLNPDRNTELSEVITHVEFHPRKSDLFCFSSSRGYMSLCDMRTNSQLSHNSLKFSAKDDPQRRHFFTDIINAMTRAKFAPSSDNYIFTRDYLSV